MRSLCLLSSFTLALVALLTVSADSYCPEDSPQSFGPRLLWLDSYAMVSLFQPANGPDSDGFSESYPGPEATIVNTPTDGGIRLDIPDKYKQRFENWKEELLSTEFGRRQWESYADNKEFILTIKITASRGKGAGTDTYLWDNSGKFVGATITLGSEIDRGYPNPIYYPVMNSLSADGTAYSISGRILAATKMSHEIGHVNQTSEANLTFLQTQNRLMPIYTSIFLKNGRNTNDQKLIDLARQMGGTPVEIWESREYWSEVNAMLYLKDRISRENFYCYVFNRIRRNIEEYAKDYEQRFDQYPEFSKSPCWN